MHLYPRSGYVANAESGQTPHPVVSCSFETYHTEAYTAGIKLRYVGGHCLIVGVQVAFERAVSVASGMCSTMGCMRQHEVPTAADTEQRRRADIAAWVHTEEARGALLTAQRHCALPHGQFDRLQVCCLELRSC